MVQPTYGSHRDPNVRCTLGMGSSYLRPSFFDTCWEQTVSVVGRIPWTRCLTLGVASSLIAALGAFFPLPAIPLFIGASAMLALVALLKRGYVASLAGLATAAVLYLYMADASARALTYLR